ncbi:hypothetical protein [Aeromonas hydrophila]|uniref:hypothetical protein n=1 Tax=Aeromonas hydrophila TaxID=644 RepID=UPI00236297A5|nr:hypothetical protein [Aeromonas hydrophila]
MSKFFYVIQLVDGCQPQTYMMTDSHIITMAEHILAENSDIKICQVKNFFFPRQELTEEEYIDFCIDAIIYFNSTIHINTFFYNADLGSDSYLFSAQYYDIDGEALDIVRLVEHELRWIRLTDHYVLSLGQEEYFTSEMDSEILA